MSPLLLQPLNDAVEPLAAHQIREHEGPVSTHSPGVAIHHFERSSNKWREIDFVDYQQAAALDARPPLAGNLVAAGYVDYVDEGVHQFGTEGGRQVVAAAFDQDQLQAGMQRLEFGNRLQVHRSVLANGGMRAPAGLHAQ